MNILLVEDRGAVAYPLIEALEEEGYTVFLAPNISRANFYWEREKIDCIIADINMSPEELSEQEIAETKAGVLTGWVWLKRYVFAQKTSMKKRTIILTAYEHNLRAEVSPEELGKIPIVSKRPLAHSPVERIIGLAKEIERKVKNEN